MRAMRHTLAIALIGSTLFTAPARAATVTVSTSDAIWAAVRAAGPNDTVLATAGTYPGLSFYSNTANPLFVKTGVTVMPVPGAKVVLGGLSLDGAAGLTFRGFEIQMAPTQPNGVVVANSARIVLDGLTIDQADGSRQGLGVSIHYSTDVSLTHSELHHLGVGVGHGDNTGLTVTDDSFHDLESDGVIGSSDNVLIARNHFKTFFPGPGEHPDAVQLWGKANYGGPIKNITIIDNIIERGDGYGVDAAGLKLTGFQSDGVTPASTMPPQGIFLEDVDTVLIQGNAMIGTMYNGIGLARGAHVNIIGNFVLGYVDMGVRIITRGGSSDVTVKDNTAQMVVTVDTEGPYPNYVVSGTVTMPPAALGDTSAMTRWLAAKGGAVTPPPIPVPAPAPTPAPVPAPTPVPVPTPVDPRDATIASLTAQRATLQGQIAALQGQLATSSSKIAALTVQLSGLQSQLTAANAKIARVIAALK